MFALNACRTTTGLLNSNEPWSQPAKKGHWLCNVGAFPFFILQFAALRQGVVMSAIDVIQQLGGVFPTLSSIGVTETLFVDQNNKTVVAVIPFVPAFGSAPASGLLTSSTVYASPSFPPLYVGANVNRVLDARNPFRVVASGT